jgi:hypothetical protein
MCTVFSLERVYHFCTFRTYAVHIVSDVHHCMQHTPFIFYVVQDCQMMGWQAGYVLTLSLPGSVHGMVHIQHWCIFAFLLPLSGSDLPPTISRHSSRADKETKMV